MSVVSTMSAGYPRRNQVRHRMSNVEFDRIIEMASPEHIGDDRQLITFTILKVVGAPCDAHTGAQSRLHGP